MKQRITVEQLNELTDEQKEKLREWWEPQVGDFFYAIDLEECDWWWGGNHEHIQIVGKYFKETGKINDVVSEFTAEYGCSCQKNNTLPLLNTGQMIELLNENLSELGRTKKGEYWAACYGQVPSYNKEPVDALWQAVKEVL